MASPSRDPWKRVQDVAALLPDLEESTSYGTPAFKVRGKLVARLHQDGASLVVRINLIDREVLLTAAPRVYFISEHYEAYPWVLMHLATATKPELVRALKQAQLEATPIPKKRR